MVFSIRRFNSGESGCPAAAGAEADGGAAFGATGAGADDCANATLAPKASIATAYEYLKDTKKPQYLCWFYRWRDYLTAFQIRRGTAATVWLFSAPKLLDRQDRIHRSRAEAFQVQGHELESQCFEDAGEFGRHGGIKRARQLGAVNLDPDDVSVMTHAELTEAELAQRFFALFHRAQCFARHRPPVLDA